MKRLFDIIVSLAGLIVLWPLFLAVAVWIKLDSPGPVFYRGKRIGRGGQPFYVYKFRSMVVDAERRGGPTTADDDPRITRSGRLLRRLKLDELAQLVNVLLGRMSLVGPRPQVADWEKGHDSEDFAVLALRPGITDWASIWNSDEGDVLAAAADPDAAYEKILHPRKRKLQRYYCRTRSLAVDVKIIFYTLMRLYRKNWLPPELTHFPTQKQLKEEVAAWQAESAQKHLPHGAPARLRAGRRRATKTTVPAEFDAIRDLPGNAEGEDVLRRPARSRELASSAR